MKTAKTLLILLLMLSSVGASAESGIEYFLFAPQGSCEDMKSLRFQHAYSFKIPLGTNLQQEPLEAELDLNLFPDGTFWARYSEKAHTDIQYRNGWRTSFARTEFEKVLEGRWSLKGKKIIIPGLGVGVLPDIQDSHRPDFPLTMTETLNDPRMRNRTFPMARSFTNIGPKGVSILQYCEQRSTP